MKQHDDIPGWIAAARKKWEYTGKARPPFAVEPKEGEVSVWDFPRPPAVMPIQEVVRIRKGENTIVESAKALSVRETANPPTVCVPPADVKRRLLTKMDGKESWCEWKGKATYWAFSEAPEKMVAWSYESPFEGYEVLKGYLAFYPHGLACYIGPERVAAQESRFYAGWVTADLTGPFKGGSGTEGW